MVSRLGGLGRTLLGSRLGRRGGGVKSLYIRLLFFKGIVDVLYRPQYSFVRSDFFCRPFEIIKDKYIL